MDAEKVEDRVREWLERSGAAFVSGHDIQASNVDFVVIAPFPLAIEVISRSSRNAMRVKTMRRLASRVALAQDLGWDTPLIAVIPSFGGAEDLQAIPFVDATLPVANLPRFESLSSVRVREETRTILAAAFQDEVPPISEPEQLIAQWREALSLEEILQNDREWKGTLAEDIRELHSEVAASQPQGFLRREHGTGAFARAVIMNPAFDKGLQQLVAERISKAVGSTPQPLSYSVPGPFRLVVRRDTWRLSSTRTLLVRAMRTGEESFAHKAIEAHGEATLIRAAVGPRKVTLVLLLGANSWSRVAGDVLPRGWTTIVNRFELAGWQVFPWDFGEEVPAFQAFVSQLKGEER